MSSASVGQWDRHYAGLVAPEPYGDSPTYAMAAEWMGGLASVEDWGCGKGWLRRLCDPAAYRGIDGSASPFADEVDDLATRDTSVEGIVLRHVLEHNDNWTEVLDNALRCCTKKLIVVLFTPCKASTIVLQREHAYGNVPVIAFRFDDIICRMPTHVTVTSQMIESPSTAYGVETVIRVMYDRTDDRRGTAGAVGDAAHAV